MNIKIILAYDGTDFLGWQEGNDGPTIEGTLRPIFEMIYQKKLQLQAASRTDRGVHAEEQVVNFFPSKEKDLDRLKISLNQLLPNTIQVKSLSIVEEKFHPTLDALGKEYHYHLFLGSVQSPFRRHYSWHHPLPLDLSLMEKTAKHFIGTHDFSSFCNASDQKPETTVRTLESITFHVEGEIFQIAVKGNRFLYKMVRNIVGTLVYVGNGKLSLEDARGLLERKDRTFAGVTAPAHGLILKRVFYPN